MRISDWSSDVCSSDLPRQSLFLYHFRLPLWFPVSRRFERGGRRAGAPDAQHFAGRHLLCAACQRLEVEGLNPDPYQWRCSLRRSEEHTSELQSLMRISYAVFCLQKKIKIQSHTLCTT